MYCVYFGKKFSSNIFAYDSKIDHSKNKMQITWIGLNRWSSQACAHPTHCSARSPWSDSPEIYLQRAASARTPTQSCKKGIENLKKTTSYNWCLRLVDPIHGRCSIVYVRVIKIAKYTELLINTNYIWQVVFSIVHTVNRYKDDTRINGIINIPVITENHQRGWSTLMMLLASTLLPTWRQYYSTARSWSC